VVEPGFRNMMEDVLSVGLLRSEHIEVVLNAREAWRRLKTGNLRLLIEKGLKIDVKTYGGLLKIGDVDPCRVEFTDDSNDLLVE